MRRPARAIRMVVPNALYSDAAGRFDGVQCFRGESQAAGEGILDTRQDCRISFKTSSYTPLMKMPFGFMFRYALSA